MIELIIIAFIVVVIVSFVSEIKTSKSNDQELRNVAKFSEATKSILGLIKAASAIKADKISCTLSIRRAYSAGNELIQQKITLQAVSYTHLRAPEIANICFSAKNALAAMHQAQDAAIKRGDSVAMHEWEKKMVEECHRIGAALSPYFPQDRADGSFLLSRFSDVEDDSLVASSTSVSVSIPSHIGTLGIDSSKNKKFRSPYVFDAVAEAARSIPNVSLSIDKTIPNQKN